MTTPSPIRQVILTMPAYNEAEGIGDLLEQATAELKKLERDWRIVVVDDGSADDTAKIVREAAQAEPRIVLVQHEQNKGLGPAILTGMKKAVEISDEETTLIVSMDADLTHPPAVIRPMIKAAEEGGEMIIASRYQPGSEVVGLSPFRHLLSWGARMLFRLFLAIPEVRDYTCGFRAVRANWIRAALRKYGDRFITRSGFACTDEILIKMALLGIAFKEVPFTLRYDLKRGSSKIKLGVTIVETLKLVVWGRRQLRDARIEVEPSPESIE